MVINYILQDLIFPPTSLILLALLGLILLKRSPTLGKTLIATALGLLTLFASHPVAHQLTAPLMIHDALSAQQIIDARPQALVIMGGGARRYAAEFDGKDTVARYTLERIRYGAILARQTGLPVLVTGGRVMTRPDRPSEAELMAEVLSDEFQVPVKWIEAESRNSFENAKFSFQMLKPEGITHIALVTHGIHMRRSVEAFEQVGFTVTAAPTVVPRANQDHDQSHILSWIPSAKNLNSSVMALHEWLGILWYRLRYY